MSETSQNNLPPPLVTVVIPCYNYVNVVARAIKSVQEQTLSNFECFIVDDGSTDYPQATILSAIDGDLRFHYIRKDNAGVGKCTQHRRFLG